MHANHYWHENYRATVDRHASLTEKNTIQIDNTCHRPLVLAKCKSSSVCSEKLRAVKEKPAKVQQKALSLSEDVNLLFGGQRKESKISGPTGLFFSQSYRSMLTYRFGP